MMSWTSLSQDSTRIKAVKVSVLKTLKKEIEKCDSLRVAYDFQFKALNNLVISNNKYFYQVKEEELKRIELQKKLDESIKALRKKRTNWILPTTIGIVSGLVGGIILTN